MTMQKFSFMLKTYENDFIYAKRLIKSFSKFNEDHIHCFVVLPTISKDLFCSFFLTEELQDVTLIDEESFQNLSEDSINGISVGYINQEIIKLSFWEKGLCRNYMCIDSETQFIRPFFYSDFMHDDEVPFSVLFEDKELKSDPLYYNTFWIERQKCLDRIADELDFHEKPFKTCHGFQTFSSFVLKTFKDQFMKSKGYSYLDLMKISPYEFTWYNLWLQKSKVIPIYQVEPIFLTFHMKHHLMQSLMISRTLDDIARSYVGIVVNSNYAKNMDISYSNVSIKERIVFLLRAAKRMLCI